MSKEELLIKKINFLHEKWGVTKSFISKKLGISNVTLSYFTAKDESKRKHLSSDRIAKSNAILNELYKLEDKNFM